MPHHSRTSREPSVLPAPADLPAACSPPLRRAQVMSSLFPLEYWLAFFQERGNAFGIVLAGAKLAHHVALKIQLFIQGVVQALIDRLFHTRHPGGGCCRKIL